MCEKFGQKILSDVGIIWETQTKKLKYLGGTIQKSEHQRETIIDVGISGIQIYEGCSESNAPLFFFWETI
jgi:hypothetical protein